MKCPHCYRPVDHEANTCYSCGYSIADAEAVFGRNFVRMSRLNDAAHCLRKPERDAVEETLDLLEFRFPQLLFCTYLGALDESMRLNELGFWLLNHAEINGADFARPNENAVLVLIDVNSKQAGISLGYFMETLLSEEEVYRALLSSRPFLLNNSYGQALDSVFRRVGRSLSRTARSMRKAPSQKRSRPQSTLPTLTTVHTEPGQPPTNPSPLLPENTPSADRLTSPDLNSRTPNTFRQAGLLAISLLVPVPAVLAGRVELPAWKDERAPGAFQLGGGLWPDSNLPKTKKDLDNLPPLPTPLPPGMSKSKPEDYNEDEHKTIVIEEEKPQPKTLKDYRVPDKIDILTIEEVPDFPPVTGELRDDYFALRPVEYLIDPQELLTEQKANDVRRFLQYHAEEAKFDIYLMLFDGSQNIPPEITLGQRHIDWFGSQPAVTVAFFMDQPERTVIEFSKEIHESLPEAVFQRIFQSCVREAQVSQNSSDQVERFAIELSIRLYWMDKLLDRQSAGETIASSQEGLAEPWELARDGEEVVSVMTPGSRFQTVLDRLGELPWTWIGSVIGILGAGFLTGFLVWRRDSLGARPILFPDRNLPSRLGGEFSGGGYIGISFDVGGGNE